MKSLPDDITVYFSLLSPDQKSSVLSLIKTFVGKNQAAKKISKKQYNKEIAAAERSIKDGNFVSEKDAKLQISKW
jgi:hypothetical protein